jgi:hypothetical protein
MFTIIVFRGGRQIEALLLSASAERLRIVIPGARDTEDFQLIDGRWLSETGVHVELGAMVAQDSGAMGRVLANARPRAFGAA